MAKNCFALVMEKTRETKGKRTTGGEPNIASRIRVHLGIGSATDKGQKKNGGRLLAPYVPLVIRG